MNDRCVNGVCFVTADKLKTPHAFSTRLGGVSREPFDSLNLGANRGDKPENVAENWRRFGAACGIPTARFVHGVQVHGAGVRIAESSDAHGILESAPWEGMDGYVTAEKGLPLVVFTADCAPLLLWDGTAGVIAAVHCGWRSTAADIMAEALRKMQTLGAEPEHIFAAVGPCIGPDCFQTGEEVPAAMKSLLGGDPEQKLWRPDEREAGHWLVDLAGIVRCRLMQLGLPRENIELSGECTMCRPDKYWSHRRTGGVRGSQANIIML